MENRIKIVPNIGDILIFGIYFYFKILYNESKGMPIYRNENIFINTKHIF